MLRIKLSNSVRRIAEEDRTIEDLLFRCLDVYENNFIGTCQYFVLDDVYALCIGPYRSASYDYVPFGTNPPRSYDISITRAFLDLIPDWVTIILL